MIFSAVLLAALAASAFVFFKAHHYFKLHSEFRPAGCPAAVTAGLVFLAVLLFGPAFIAATVLAVKLLIGVILLAALIVGFALLALLFLVIALISNSNNPPTPTATPTPPLNNPPLSNHPSHVTSISSIAIPHEPRTRN